MKLIPIIPSKFFRMTLPLMLTPIDSNIKFVKVLNYVSFCEKFSGNRILVVGETRGIRFFVIDISERVRRYQCKLL